MRQQWEDAIEQINDSTKQLSTDARLKLLTEACIKLVAQKAQSQKDFNAQDLI